MSADKPNTIIEGGEAAGKSMRRRKAVGPERRVYFSEGDVDRVMAIVLALVSEVAAIRERLDTHERVSGGQSGPSRERVESYEPDPGVDAEREAWRDGYIRRLFRVITEDLEQLERNA